MTCGQKWTRKLVVEKEEKEKLRRRRMWGTSLSVLRDYLHIRPFSSARKKDIKWVKRKAQKSFYLEQCLGWDSLRKAIGDKNSIVAYHIALSWYFQNKHVIVQGRGNGWFLAPHIFEEYHCQYTSYLLSSSSLVVAFICLFVAWLACIDGVVEIYSDLAECKFGRLDLKWHMDMKRAPEWGSRGF